MWQLSINPAKGTQTIDVIQDATYFLYNANLDSLRLSVHKLLSSLSFKSVTLFHCCIVFKASRSNIGSPALLDSYTEVTYFHFQSRRLSDWHIHTQAQSLQNSKWQSFPVNTCHLIYARLKLYRSINPLFSHVSSTRLAAIIESICMITHLLMSSCENDIILEIKCCWWNIVSQKKIKVQFVMPSSKVKKLVKKKKRKTIIQKN